MSPATRIGPRLAALLIACCACRSGEPEHARAGQQTAPPEPLAPLPSPQQVAWQELEYYAFVHFNMNTFTNEEWGAGKEPESAFAPTQLDCRQWARVAREAGMRGIILTAKHHDGFCLWPSKLTEHSVENSLWRGGKGDVLRELSDACRDENLKFGVYLSPWDRNSQLYGDSPRYNAYFEGQLAEVLSNYGRVFEVWFDGACGEGPNGKRQEYDWDGFVRTVRRLQPDAVIFSDVGPDVRWVGNEAGIAGETCWSMLSPAGFTPGAGGPPAEVLNQGQETGTRWIPPECDVSIRPGWYYHAEQDGEVKSLAALVDIWEGSVGRNGNLLLNLPVDRRGLVHENDAQRLLELRRWVDAAYADDLARGARASASNERGSSRGDATSFCAGNAIDGDRATYWATDDEVREAWLELDLGAPKAFNRVVLREPIELGQRVAEFRIEVWSDAHGRWIPFASGTTIGNRRILRVPETKAQRVRVAIQSARGCPALSSFALHLAPPAGPG